MRDSVKNGAEIFEWFLRHRLQQFRAQGLLLRLRVTSAKHGSER